MAFHGYASFKGSTQGHVIGDSSKAERKDKWIDLLKVDFGPSSLFNDKGKPTSTKGHVTITKQIGAASPQLLSAHWKAELFTEVVVEIVGRPSSGAGEVVTERITLTNAIIRAAKPHVGGSITGGKPATDFTLDYKAIQRLRL
jgi:type VI secretion system Hcp family effector